MTIISDKAVNEVVKLDQSCCSREGHREKGTKDVQEPRENHMEAQPKVDIYKARGLRGNLPDNTVILYL